MSQNPDLTAVVEGTLGRMVEQNLIQPESYVKFYDILVQKVVKYVSQDTFTVALLIGMDGVTQSVGVSKRNPTDQKLPLRGRSLALSRAIREFILKNQHDSEVMIVK